METINAGKATDFFNKIIDKFFDSLKGIFEGADEKLSYKPGEVRLDDSKIPDNPVLDDKGKPLSENSAILECIITLQWPEENPLTRADAEKLIQDYEKTWLPAEKLDIQITFKRSNKVSKQGITFKDAMKLLSKYCADKDIYNQATKYLTSKVLTFKEISKAEANSSKRLQVTLKKITCDTEVQINMTKINANYDILEALDDVNTIVSDDEFVDQLPDDTEVCYEVLSDDAEYDVNECSDFDCADSIQYMINMTFRMMAELRMRKITASGDEYDMVLNACESMLYQLDVVLSALSDARYDMDYEGVDDIEVCIPGYSYENKEDVFELIFQSVHQYLDSLQVVYDCCSKGIQAKLDYSIQQIEDAMRSCKKRS